jgi:hypothetical protein
MIVAIRPPLRYYHAVLVHAHDLMQYCQSRRRPRNSWFDKHSTPWPAPATHDHAVVNAQRIGPQVVVLRID